MWRVIFSHLDFLLDFVYDASMLLVAKTVCRRGDGDANMSIWKIHLTDFYSMNHVTNINGIN